MTKAYIFDIDNTLTDPKEEMDSKFAIDFFNWMKDKIVYITTGGTYERVVKQIPKNIREKCEAIFPLLGSDMYKNDEVIHKSSHEFPPEIRELMSSYVTDINKCWDDRGAIINFALCGQNATKKERKRYASHDLLEKERELIATNATEKFPDYDFQIGGMVSIDILPKGCNKSQILKYISQEDLVFFGDKILPGGNDYHLGEAVIERGGLVHNVHGWRHVRSYISNLGKFNLMILTGGFDPIHSGHINMFKAASDAVGEKGLVVTGLNSDDWLIRKKDKVFMPEEERITILKAIRYSDDVKIVSDNDDSVINCIKEVIEEYGVRYNIIMGNGGDRTPSNTAEVQWCQDNEIDMAWNLGGCKTQSSSWITG